VDVLQAEGLDLDLVEQMKDLAIVRDNRQENSSSESTNSLLSAFDVSSVGTKVRLIASIC
jgi:hypothetical protein